MWIAALNVAAEEKMDAFMHFRLSYAAQFCMHPLNQIVLHFLNANLAAHASFFKQLYL